MSHEYKAFLIWLAAMTLFVVAALAATTLYPMTSVVSRRAAVIPGAPLPPLPAPIEVSPWRLVQ
jgi:hypothetical protein